MEMDKEVTQKFKLYRNLKALKKKKKDHFQLTIKGSRQNNCRKN